MSVDFRHTYVTVRLDPATLPTFCWRCEGLVPPGETCCRRLSRRRKKMNAKRWDQYKASRGKYLEERYQANQLDDDSWGPRSVPLRS